MISDLRFKLAFGIFLACMGTAIGVARLGFWLAEKVDA